MGVGRILVLALAAVAGLFVAYYVRTTQGAPAASPTVVETTEVVELPATRILVARTSLRAGQRVTASDIGWQPWPEQAVFDTFLTEADYATAVEDYAGAVARADIHPGEPITGRKLVNPGDAGFMAAVLAPGMRAVSVSITAESGAGGFILPGDRVDVILTHEIEIDDGRTTRDEHVSRTILENIKVLAIDQLPRQEEDEQAVVGSTATLELPPEHAETIALAEALGDITLALRSVVESGVDALAGGRSAGLNPDQGARRTIYRFGSATPVTVGGTQ